MTAVVGQQADVASASCRVCGSRSLRPAYTLAEFSVANCSRCSHGTTVYRTQITDSQARFNGARWTETRGMLRGVTDAMAERRYDDLRPFHPAADLLEIGCGTGEFLNFAQGSGHRVTGLDTSEQVAAYVSQCYGIDVRVATLSDSGLAPESFDVVVAFHVLEHVADPVTLLAEMAGILRPNGMVYVRVPNMDSWYRRALGRNWWDFCREHMSHFTGRSLDLALQDAGLKVRVIRSADSDPGHSWWPVLPLLAGHGVLLRSLGSALQPPAGDGPQSVRSGWDSRRAAVKRGLLGAYFGYRRAGSMMLGPMVQMQIRRGGGQELLAVAVKPGPE